MYVHSGRYSGGITLADIRGTADAPIWIAGFRGESRPLITGGGDGVHFVKPEYVVVEDLEIGAVAGHGINIDDGDDVANRDAARSIVLRDLAIHDTGLHPAGVADCLKLSGVSELAVLHSAFEHCGNGPGSGAVGVGGIGVHKVIVAFNRYTANGYGAVQMKGGSDDVEIVGNLVRDPGWRGLNMGGRTDPAAFRPPLTTSGANYEAARIRAQANVFVGGEAAVAFTGCVDCEFSHNTVIDPTKWAIRILQETVSAGPFAFAPASRGRIVDNIFYFRREELNTGEDINIGAGTSPESFSLARNLWYAHDAPRQSAPRIGRVGSNTDAIVGVDPTFVDLDHQDFHLRPRSAALAVGDGRFTPRSDADGLCYGAPPSLGAFR